MIHFNLSRSITQADLDAIDQPWPFGDPRHLDARNYMRRPLSWPGIALAALLGAFVGWLAS